MSAGAFAVIHVAVVLYAHADVISRLKAVEPQLRAFGVGGLYLFGSYARNEAGPDSDVDIFIDRAPGTELDLDAFIGAYDVLKSALPVHVDCGTRTGLSKFIRDEVEREAIRVF
ncbi:DNA polymerase III subunit beta [Bradyrhizobium sp. CCBAU 11445]|uniref:nucleotidyltransferase family protein n=1 Tax=unclassified Bradyrhizobium TaxID=2631580 RepID=UPI002306DAFF|nr:MULTISPECIES: nucleotidyltransferase domain-containing protein [unclassified Bradyrhizobium]MDA9453539.1 DNA polymerase III subunit beta [Bradyrhizobium sp. CCBAU 21359]MDA9483300.1 DNA polymerase III subunit beta [Bradyrhizobium sp. CCBAU 11445]MDA9519057.1 DNA polymerase III subunit beta [Bradyrhizobium sp. CCBAU 11434]